MDMCDVVVIGTKIEYETMEQKHGKRKKDRNLRSGTKRTIKLNSPFFLNFGYFYFVYY